MTNDLNDLHVKTYYSLMLHTVQKLMFGHNTSKHEDFSFDSEEVEGQVDPAIVREMKPVIQFEQTLANVMLHIHGQLEFKRFFILLCRVP